MTNYFYIEMYDLIVVTKNYELMEDALRRNGYTIYKNMRVIALPRIPNDYCGSIITY